jgi:hypothetical protein
MPKSKYKLPNPKHHRTTKKARYEILFEIMEDRFQGLADGLKAVHEKLDRI